MVLRKITIDNSVKYVPITEKKTLKKLQQKIKNKFKEKVCQTKNFQRIIKNLLKISQQEDLEYLNEYRIVTFNKKNIQIL